MAFIDGDDFINGSILSFQQANRMKDNFRLATPPSNIQPGMLHSDSDDDKLHHQGAAASEELLQETRSFDIQPKFLGVELVNGAYSAIIQESQAEGLVGADTRIGLDETLRTLIVCDVGDIAVDFGLIASTFPKFYVMDADGDSWVAISHGVDDHPEIEWYSNESADKTILRSVKDGTGQQSFRIGLDETTRRLVILDRGDIAIQTVPGLEQGVNMLDADFDSYIYFCFSRGDDLPELIFWSAISSDGTTLLASDSEGIASSCDFRIGLDETMRTLILCDRGDVAVDFGLTAETHPTLKIMKNNGTLPCSYKYTGFEATSSVFLKAAQWNLALIADVASGDAFYFYGAATGELTSSNSEQAFISYAPFINQTLTANYIGILINATHTSLGSGTNKLIDYRVSGSTFWDIYWYTGYPIFRLYDSGPAYSVSLRYNQLYATGAFEYMSTATQTHKLNADLAAGNAWDFISGAGKELTDDNGEQAWIYIEPKINQTLTAGYVVILVNVTQTSVGDGSAGAGYNALMDLRVTGTTQFGIQNDGKIMTNQTSSGTSLGSVTDKFPVYDGSGTLVGYVPIYDAIT